LIILIVGDTVGVDGTGVAVVEPEVKGVDKMEIDSPGVDGIGEVAEGVDAMEGTGIE
jgi:hypothetical protein